MDNELYSELKVAKDALHRYSGSKVEDFQPYLLLTNFPKYVIYFAEKYGVPVTTGSMFTAAHAPAVGISILDFKIGSPAAAFVIDLCARTPFKAALLLGMCGGLRKHYSVGEYFLPVAGIRKEGTSDFYLPPEVPAMANFLVQKAVTNILDQEHINYHIGITYTTNIRFWEFNDRFKEELKRTHAQAVEMECATVFTASYRYKLPVGALLLISDLPLFREGAKTKASSEQIFATYMAAHVDAGIRILQHLRGLQEKHSKGAFRGSPTKPEAAQGFEYEAVTTPG